MATINVYQQYFAAQCTWAGVDRRGVSVVLASDSEAGHIAYSLTVAFFPHREADDFAIAYDATQSATLYDAPGRRSRRREAEMMASLRPEADRLAASLGGTIDWDRPLAEPRLG